MTNHFQALVGKMKINIAKMSKLQIQFKFFFAINIGFSNLLSKLKQENLKWTNTSFKVCERLIPTNILLLTQLHILHIKKKEILYGKSIYILQKITFELLNLHFNTSYYMHSVKRTPPFSLLCHLTTKLIWAITPLQSFILNFIY